MKYTPLDIQRRTFETAFRGLNEAEVRSFLHEVGSEWEELSTENQRLREEVLDLRERLKQYQDQDRIFRETLMQAQRTREDVLEDTKREKHLILKEAEFKAEETLRDAQALVVELETQMRSMRMERTRLVHDIEALMARTRRFLEAEVPEFYQPASPTLRLEPLDPETLEQLDSTFKKQS